MAAQKCCWHIWQRVDSRQEAEQPLSGALLTVCLLCRLQPGAPCPSPNNQSPAPQHPTLTKGFPIWHPIQNPNLSFAPDTGLDLIGQFSPSLESFKPMLSSQAGHRLGEQRNYSRTVVGSTCPRCQAPTKAALTLPFPPLSQLPGQGKENFTKGSWV